MPDCELVVVPTLAEALPLLLAENFAGIYISAQDPVPWQQARVMLQNEAILEILGEGVAILQPDSRILWANPTLEKWCGGPLQGRLFGEAVGTPALDAQSH